MRRAGQIVKVTRLKWSLEEQKWRCTVCQTTFVTQSYAEEDPEPPCYCCLAKRLPNLFEPDELGQAVQGAWAAWARTLPNCPPAWKREWHEVTEQMKEADRQIGIALLQKFQASLVSSGMMGVMETSLKLYLLLLSTTPEQLLREPMRVLELVEHLEAIRQLNVDEPAARRLLGSA